MELLKLIENVDPTDTDALDEIDARVCCYYDQSFTLETYNNGKNFAIRDKYGWSGAPIEYTRSRDASKRIRPQG